MITLPELLGELARSGRSLEPRTARDWWGRGLLPSPWFKGLGKGRGRRAVWRDPRVLERARIAVDLRRQRLGLDRIIVALWLCGHAVEFPVLRRAWVAALGGKTPPRLFAHRHGGDPQLGVLAEASGLARAFEASSQAREAIEACLAAVIGDHWGIGDPNEGEALGAACEAFLAALASRNPAAPRPEGLIDDGIADEVRGFLATFSRPAIIALVAIESPDRLADRELLRARRMLHLMAGRGLRDAAGRLEAAWVHLSSRVGLIALPAIAAHLRTPVGRGRLATLLAARPSRHWRRHDLDLGFAIRGGNLMRPTEESHG